MKALISKEFSLQSITEMTPEEQNRLAKSFVKEQKGLKEDRDTLKESAKVVGKVLCALEIRLNAGIKQNFFAANLSLADFFKEITGEKPQTHVLTLKNVFGAFVSTNLITETDYDCNSGNCLELAGQIVKAVNGDLTHEAVTKAAAQLTERSNKEAKNLREILVSVKPTAKLTPKEALEMIQRIASDGQLAVVLAELPDIAEKLPEPEQQSYYLAMATALERTDAKFGDRAEKWIAERTKSSAAPEIITPEKPAAGTPEADAAILKIAESIGNAVGEEIAAAAAAAA